MAIPFSSQFRKCRREALVKPGPHVTETMVRYYVRDDTSDTGVRCRRGPREVTVQTLLCGRFPGTGQCGSGNPGCRKLRGVQ